MVAEITHCQIEVLTLYGNTLGGLLDYLGRLYGGEFRKIVEDFRHGDGSYYVEVNGSRTVDPLHELHDGDEVHIRMPLAGG
ncbi:MAG: hypothetical protein HPY55_10455 [Firmicutes bacterium]|nr:hypothetical protein [Bacillota bacterium]